MHVNLHQHFTFERGPQFYPELADFGRQEFVLGIEVQDQGAPARDVFSGCLHNGVPKLLA